MKFRNKRTNTVWEVLNPDRISELKKSQEYEAVLEEKNAPKKQAKKKRR